MKKQFTRLLAMLLCIWTFAAVLPGTVLAAENETDKVAPAVELIAENAAAFANAKTTTKTYKLGKTVTLKVTVPSYYIRVKYQWQYKTRYGGKWIDIKKGTKKTYSFKVTTGKNGYSYRCKYMCLDVPGGKWYYSNIIKIKVKK